MPFVEEHRAGCLQSKSHTKWSSGSPSWNLYSYEPEQTAPFSIFILLEWAHFIHSIRAKQRVQYFSRLYVHFLQRVHFNHDRTHTLPVFRFPSTSECKFKGRKQICRKSNLKPVDVHVYIINAQSLRKQKYYHATLPKQLNASNAVGNSHFACWSKAPRNVKSYLWLSKCIWENNRLVMNMELVERRGGENLLSIKFIQCQLQILCIKLLSE